MKSIFLILAAACAVLLFAPRAANAQATRTWISGVGDDANPCSRTAPCKTFAGAISKTPAGGEIDCLDPGGFGAVTITKSITLDCAAGQGGQAGSILASGGQGVVVNAGTTDKVVIRNLDINGAGRALGTQGINFLAGHALSIENVSIQNFSGYCVTVQSSGAKLAITGSILRDCAQGGLTSSSSSGIDRIDVYQSTIERSGVGVTFNSNVAAVISFSVIGNNPGGGVLVQASTAELEIFGGTVANNQAFGLEVASNGVIGISGASIVLNNGPGLLVSSGQIVSGGNNWIHGNNPDGSPTSTPGLK